MRVDVFSPVSPVVRRLSDVSGLSADVADDRHR